MSSHSFPQALSSAALDREEAAGGAISGRFAPREGHWRETKQALQLASATRDYGNLVTELDPDASTRQGKPLHPANVEDEARLHAALFRLLRAGRLRAAWELCRHVGQPWRAASMGAASGWGPAPVGAAAAADAEEQSLAGPAAELDALAAELDGADPQRRALWKWACGRVAAEAAAQGAAAEAAVYGVLAGDPSRVLPLVSGDWEGSLWALLRARLDCDVDALVEGRDPSQPGAPLAEPSELPAGVAAPAWPPQELLASLCTGLEDAFRRLAAGPDGAVARACGAQQRVVQRALALGSWAELAAVLQSWLGLDAGSAAAAVAAAESALGPAAQPPASKGRHARLLRLSAHVLLWLRLLLGSDAGFQPGGPRSFDLDKVLYAYAGQLCAGERYGALPMYAKHLRPIKCREAVASCWSLLVPQPRALKQRVLREACEYLPWEGEGGVLAVLATVLDASRGAATAALGPVPRLKALEWACLVPDTAPQAALHAASLLRELCLAACAGDVACAEAAQALVDEVLSGALLAEAAQGSARLGAAGRELVQWALFVRAADLYRRWRAHFEARARRGGAAAGPAERAAGEDALSALLSAVDCDSLGWFRDPALSPPAAGSASASGSGAGAGTAQIVSVSAMRLARGQSGGDASASAAPQAQWAELHVVVAVLRPDGSVPESAAAERELADGLAAWRVAAPLPGAIGEEVQAAAPGQPGAPALVTVKVRKLGLFLSSSLHLHRSD